MAGKAGYLNFSNFKFGLDKRRSEQTTQPGALLRVKNAVVNQGAELEKRKAFVRIALPANVYGGLANASTIMVWGSVAAPSLPTGVTYQRLQVSSFIPGSWTMIGLVSATLLNERFFVVALFSNGSVEKTFCFFDGQFLMDFWSGMVWTGATSNASLATQLAAMINATDNYSAVVDGVNPAKVNITSQPGFDFSVATLKETALGTMSLNVNNRPIQATAAAYASGSFRIVTGWVGGVISSITVGNAFVKTVICTNVAWNGNVNAFAIAVATAINNNSGVSNYSATAVKDTVVINALTAGSDENKKVITIQAQGVSVVSGSLAFSGTGFTLATLSVSGNSLITGTPVFPCTGHALQLAKILAVPNYIAEYTHFGFTFNNNHGLTSGYNQITIEGTQGNAWDGTYNNLVTTANAKAASLLFNNSAGITACYTLTNTTQRAISAGVATLTAAAPFPVVVDDLIYVEGVTEIGGRVYNGFFIVTGVVGNTITYATTGSNEVTTADVGGKVYVGKAAEANNAKTLETIAGYVLALSQNVHGNAATSGFDAIPVDNELYIYPLTCTSADNSLPLDCTVTPTAGYFGVVGLPSAIVSGFSAQATPPSVGQALQSNGTRVSKICTAVPTEGQGPYTFAWQELTPGSGNGIRVDASSMAATTFSRPYVVTGSRVTKAGVFNITTPTVTGQFVCNITNGYNQTVATNVVKVTL